MDDLDRGVFLFMISIMQIEYEATYPDINKDEVREKLLKAGASLIRPEFLQKRYTFNLPSGH